MQEAILIILSIVLIKLLFMSDKLNEIKADLIAANDKITKVAADVQRLHDAIEAAGDAPTPEEWAEVKQLSTDLNTALQNIDDSTPE